MTENTLYTDPVDQANQAIREFGHVNYAPGKYLEIIAGLLRKIGRINGEIIQHELKIWPEYFDPVESGMKPFEIRKNDRDFQVNDELRLLEWNPQTGQYTGREMIRRITYVFDPNKLVGQTLWHAVAKHYVVLGLCCVAKISAAPVSESGA